MAKHNKEKKAILEKDKEETFSGDSKSGVSALQSGEVSEEAKTDTDDVEVEIKKDLEKESELNPAKLLEENISLKNKIGDLMNQVNEFKQKWIYTFSEYENYRKRVKKEIESEVKSRVSKIIENFIDAVDSIESAMNYITDENTRAGIKLIKDIIEKAIEKSGAKKIEFKEGDFLDPAKCEVVDFIQSDKAEDDRKIVKIVSTGFEFEGRIIRPVRVIVWRKKQDGNVENDKVEG